jgi:hypothetical protein
MFASNLTANYNSNKIALAWSAAFDNQYASENGAKIGYEIYRKQGSAFATATNPGGDVNAALITTVNNDTTYLDGSIASNVTYYYGVCAVDSSGNRKCDGTVRSVTTPDVEAPVISNLTTTKATDPDAKEWDITWNMSDNSSSATLKVTVKAYYSSDPMPPTDSAIYGISPDVELITEADGITSVEDLQGPPNEDHYIHYWVSVKDLAGNTSAFAVTTVYSQNLVTITEVLRGDGTTLGGKYIIVKGTGFVDGATVQIGSAECEDAKVYRSTEMGCITPAQAAGTYSVYVTNPNGAGQASMGSAYTYIDPNDASAHLCDKPANQGASFSGGDGSQTTPYLICNGAQLDALRTINQDKYFELKDNIDLSSYTSNSFAPIESADATDSWNGSSFEGNDYYIGNWTYSSATDYTGLFKKLVRSKVQNTHFVNIDVSATGNNLGIVTGYMDGANCAVWMQNVSVQGKVTGNGAQNVGGVIGYIWRGNVDQVRADVEVSGSDPLATNDLWRVGGFAGYAANCAFSNIHVKGTMQAVHYEIGGIIGGLYSPGHLTQSSFEGTVTKTDIGGHPGMRYGGAVGVLTGRVTHTTVKGSVTGVDRVGGVVGYGIYGVQVTDNYFEGTVANPYNNVVGGILGKLWPQDSAVVARNRAIVSIDVPHSVVGGIVGHIEKYGSTANPPDQTYTLEDNYASGTIKAKSYAGGIIGSLHCYNYSTDSCISTIRRNHSDVDIETAEGDAGGFIGFGQISETKGGLYENYATGNVKAGYQCAGGFAGRFGGLLTDSYATGNVTAYDKGASFIGCPASATSDYFRPILKRVYGTGQVITGLGMSYGGLYAYEWTAVSPEQPRTYEASFWDKETTGLATSVGPTAQVIGKTTAEMQDEDTFINAGWDFDTIWKIPAGGGYPVLQWQP